MKPKKKQKESLLDILAMAYWKEKEDFICKTTKHMSEPVVAAYRAGFKQAIKQLEKIQKRDK